MGETPGPDHAGPDHAGPDHAGGGATAPGPRPVTVLHSLRAPKPGATTYVDQMVQGAPASVRVGIFTWKRALLGRYDVLHVHWPELMVRDRSWWRGFVKRRAFDALLVRLALQRIPVVWTAHNLEPHENGAGPEQRTLRKFSRAVDLAIRLNPTTELPEDLEAVTILHGHYRQQFAGYPPLSAEPGRLLYFGIIRPYKGVDALVEAFRALPDPEMTLRIVGDPHPGQREMVEAAETTDARISSTLAFVSDEELVRDVYRAQLVVLPYKEKMHNSGSVLVALSLGRPVLVPASPTNAALAAEVGAEWVLQYDGALTARVLADALEQTRSLPSTGAPRLEGRDWDHVGAQHEQAYRQAMNQRRDR